SISGRYLSLFSHIPWEIWRTPFTSPSGFVHNSDSLNPSNQDQSHSAFFSITFHPTLSFLKKFRSIPFPERIWHAPMYSFAEITLLQSPERLLDRLLHRYRRRCICCSPVIPLPLP